jgi:hypothetical protein
MSAQIIEFGRARDSVPAIADLRREVGPVCSKDLRKQRWKAWRKAEAEVGYWDSLHDFTSSVLIAKSHGLAAAKDYVMSEASRLAALDEYREAVARLLLTPASRKAEVNWKRAFIVGRQNVCIPVTKEQLERVIADDLTFLNAHRRSDVPLLT